MREEQLTSYALVNDRDGLRTYFRKFDEGTWIFQYNEEGKNIGGVIVSNDTLHTIMQAPSLKVGDAKTKQTLAQPDDSSSDNL